MKTTSQPHSSADAFTLVELLTVIAIIAILMGLLFPAIGIVKEQARKVQAKNDVTNIVTAVKAYYTEYGKYPPCDAVGAPTTPDKDVLVGDPGANATITNNVLFNTLRSIAIGQNADYVFNPRRIVFFEGKSATDPANPRAGFLDNNDPALSGNFYDPWGKQYNVIMDTNYDNTISVSDQYSDFDSATNPVRVGAGAFSMGKDNALGNAGNNQYRTGGTASDDVVSWQ